MGDPPGAVQAMARAADSTLRSDETSRRTLQDRRRRVWRLVRIAHAWLLLRERGFVRALRRTTGADAGLILAGGLIRSARDDDESDRRASCPVSDEEAASGRT